MSDGEARDWLAECHETARLMESEADQMEFVADRLAFVILQSPAVTYLWAGAKRLRAQAERLRGAVGDKVYADVQWAQDHSNNMLRATIAGMLMAKTEDEEQRAALAGLAGAIPEPAAPRD